jgi:hypothetical protein
MRAFLSSLCIALTFSACSGGGSDSDGVVFQGAVTERGSGHSAEAVIAKHSAGQRIGDVKVCILGECSITDDMGQWGVNVSDFTGGDISVVLEGHGISSSVVANLPSTAKDIEMDLDHANNVVSIAKLMIDGEDHTGHDHDHNSHSDEQHEHLTGN